VVPNGGAQIGSGDGLNYLQIESFRFSANDTPDMVRAEVNQARAFLAERGVKTVLRRHPKGYVLYAEEGYPKGSQAESSRREFADRIEALGKEYRKDGGRYEFKGCYFVSADHLTRGQPE
jgi:hypothetical protein